LWFDEPGCRTAAIRFAPVLMGQIDRLHSQIEAPDIEGLNRAERNAFPGAVR
jgi:hypothetical protein